MSWERLSRLGISDLEVLFPRLSFVERDRIDGLILDFSEPLPAGQVSHYYLLDCLWAPGGAFLLYIGEVCGRHHDTGIVTGEFTI